MSLPVRGQLRSLAPLLVVLTLGACSAKPQVVTPPPGVSGVSATPIAAPSGTGDLGTWPLGSSVALSMPAPGASVSQTPAITVVKYERQPSCKDASPGNGDAFVGVSVAYVAGASPLPYAASDWSAHGDAGPVTIRSRGCYRDLLGSGSATAVSKAAGWLLLDVPTATAHLWVRWQGEGRTASWKLY